MKNFIVDILTTALVVLYGVLALVLPAAIIKFCLGYLFL